MVGEVVATCRNADGTRRHERSRRREGDRSTLSGSVLNDEQELSLSLG